MDILLRPANEVPDLFVDRLQMRSLGERALATTMSIDFSDNPLIEGWVEHGLPDDVLAVDYYGHANGPSALSFGHKGHEEARRDFVREFQGSYVILGEPKHDKYYQGKVVHRSHIKALAVGSQVLSLGGVNFVNYAYEHYVDAMLDFRSPEFANFLTSFIEQNGNLRDREEPGTSFALSDQNEVIVDYGKDHESLIMHNVLADLTSSDVRSVVMSSSYGPAGHLYGGLHGVAETGGRVTVYTNNLGKFQKPHAAMLEREMQGEDLARIAFGNLGRHHRIQVIDSLPDSKFNHLKTIIIEKADGSKVAYMGSHNFNPLPVRFGTAEVALRTTDPTVIAQIEDFIEDNLALPEADLMV